MHALAPMVIILGGIAALVGLLWLYAAGSETDGGPDSSMFFLFGWWYLGARVTKQLADDPMSVLPAFGFLLGGGGMIWLGIKML